MKRWLLFIFLLLIGFQFGTNYLLRRGLEALFSQETGCELSLEHVWANFMLRQGTASPATLRCADAPEGEVLEIGRLAVKIHLLPLLWKKVKLYDLELHDVVLSSDRKESGFNRLMWFIIEPPRVRPWSWHSFISDGWKVDLKNMIVVTADTRPVPMLLGYEFGTVDAEAVKLELYWPSRPEPILLHATGRELRLAQSDGALALLETAAISMQIDEGVLDFRRVALTAKEEQRVVQLMGHGSVDLNNPDSYSASYSGSGDLGVLLQRFGIASLPAVLDGATVWLEGKLSSVQAEPVATAQFKTEFTSIASLSENLDCELPAIVGDIEYSQGSVTIQRIQAEPFVSDGSVDISSERYAGQISITMPGAIEFKKYCTFREEETVSADPLYTFIEQALFDSTLSVTLKGDTKPFSLIAEVDSKLRRADPSDESSLHAAVSLANNKLSIDFKESATFGAIRSVQRGEMFATTFTESEPALLSGTLNIDMTADTVVLDKLRLKNFPVEKVWHRVSPFLPDGEDLKVVSENLTKGFLDITGAIQVQQGEVSSGSFQLKIADGVLAGFLVTEGSAAVELTPQSIQVESIELGLEEGFAQFSGVTDWSGVGSFRGEVQGIQLQQVTAWKGLYPGVVGSADVLISGELQLPKTSVTISLQAHTKDEWEDEVLPVSNAEIAISEGVITGKGQLFGGMIPFSIEQQKNNGFTHLITLDAKKMPLRFLSASAIDRKPPFDGTLSLTFDYTFAEDQPLMGKGIAAIQDIVLPDGTSFFKTNGITSPPLINFANGKARLEHTQLQAGENTLTIEGHVTRDAGWNASVSGAWDIANIIPVHHLEQVSGLLTANLRISGALTEPVISGPLTLSQGSLSLLLDGQIVGIDAVDIQSEFTAGAVTISRIVGSFGGGQIIGSGAVNNPFSTDSRDTAIALEINKVYLEPVRDVSLLVDGSLQFEEGAVSGCAVRGNLSLSEGLYRTQIDLKDLLTKTSAVLTGSRRVQRTANEEAGAAACLIDVMFRSRGGIQVETPLLSTELKGNVQISGESGSIPSFIGDIQFLGGTIGLRSKQFEVIHGNLRFPKTAREINPELDILAETTVRNNEGEDSLVQMFIRGMANNPQVSFTSEQGMAENEIIASLGFGTTIQNVSLFGSEGTERSVGSLLNPVSKVNFGERLAGLTGLSEVQIESVVSSRTGETIPRFSTERRLLGSIRGKLATELGVVQESFATVEYPLTPYLNLVGGWKSSPVTRNIETSSGSLHSGFEYRSGFPGTSIIPWDLGW